MLTTIILILVAVALAGGLVSLSLWAWGPNSGLLGWIVIWDVIPNVFELLVAVLVALAGGKE